MLRILLCFTFSVLLAVYSGCGLLPQSEAPIQMDRSAENHTIKRAPRTSSRRSNKDSVKLRKQLAKARNLERNGRLTEARDIYTHLTRQFPGAAEPFRRLAVVADRQRRHNEALSLYQRALAIDPLDAETLNDLGYCYYLQGQLRKAEAAVLKATRLARREPRYHNNLGLIYGAQQRFDEALDAFRRAGSEADAQHNLAFVYTMQNKIDEAKSCFRRALAADPSHDKSRKALAAFDQYERDPEAAELAVLDRDPHYVPYVEGSEGGTSSAVQPASHQGSISSPRQAGNQTRALLQRAQALLDQKRAEQQ